MKKTTKKNPITTFRKNFEARNAMVTKSLPKAQKGKTVTPFQNYMKTPGAMASDTSDVFTGNRDGLNPKLDKAYYDTYYAGQENKRRKGADAIKYDAQGNRVGKQTVHKTGGPVKTKMKVGGAAKATKFAALAKPFNKATAADRIAGAKKNARKKK